MAPLVPLDPLLTSKIHQSPLNLIATLLLVFEVEIFKICHFRTQHTDTEYISEIKALKWGHFSLSRNI